jgi:hypothetical protein
MKTQRQLTNEAKLLAEEGALERAATRRRIYSRLARTTERLLQTLQYGIVYAVAIVVDYALFELIFALLERDAIVLPGAQTLLMWLRFATLLAGIVCATIHLGFSLVGQIRLEYELYKEEGENVSESK